VRANDVVQFLGDQVHLVVGNLDREIKGASSIFHVSDGSLTFCNSDVICEGIAPTDCTVIVPSSFFPTKTEGENTYIVVANAMLCFTRALKFFAAEKDASGEDSTTKIDDQGFIHESVVVGPHCVIGKCSIGEGSCIGAYTVIGDGAFIGKNVKIREFCSIGCPGFGFVRNENGSLERMLQIGRTVIEDDVELFPYVNVDRGTLHETRIERGSKIDHYSHIGHNTTVGRDCLITAHVVLCGGSKVGSRSFLGVGSVLRQDIIVGNDVEIGIGSVVTKSILSGSIAYGNPCKIIGRKE